MKVLCDNEKCQMILLPPKKRTTLIYVLGEDTKSYFLHWPFTLFVKTNQLEELDYYDSEYLLLMYFLKLEDKKIELYNSPFNWLDKRQLCLTRDKHFHYNSRDLKELITESLITPFNDYDEYLLHRWRTGNNPFVNIHTPYIQELITNLFKESGIENFNY